MENTKTHFEQEIFACKRRLKELEPYIKTNNALAVVYNQVLVRKAILTDKYKKQTEKNNIYLDKLRKMFTFNYKKRLICDFFHE